MKANMDENFRERIELLISACDDEFNFSEIMVLFDDMIKCLPHETIHDIIKCHDYFRRKYHEMKMRDSKKEILHPLSYMRALIGT
jgi:hypothetical protein